MEIDLDKYDVYYSGEKIEDIFDYSINSSISTYYLIFFYVSKKGKIEQVSGNAENFVFRKKEF